MATRRTFLKMGALATAGAAIGGPFARRAWTFAQSPTRVRKFIVGLPGVGPAGANQIGQYLPLATRNSVTFAGQLVDSFEVVAARFSQRMHADLPGKTAFYGYADTTTRDQKYLGGIIVARRGTPAILSVTNLLPISHILPLDPTLMAGPAELGGPSLMVGDLPVNRLATHLHGGLTPWFSDGTPLQWFTPAGMHGPSFMNLPGVPAAPGTATYYYPNDQSGRLIWYHDHAIGITRLNVYAGLAAAYIIIDDFEVNLVNQGLLPDLIGIPLVIQDKGFVSPNVHVQDPSWRWGEPGDLWYPHQYQVNVDSDDTANSDGRWDWGATVVPPVSGTTPLPPVSSVPEAFFDTPLINGALYPAASVAPRRVRFRLLNAAQARFFHLSVHPENRSVSGEADLRFPGPRLYQIGTEGGLLPRVAVHDNTRLIPLDPDDDSGTSAVADGPFNLLLAPAERADCVIDFNGVPAGSSFILYNDAPAPFPCGDSRNDYFTGDLDQTLTGGAPATIAGHGPNIRTLMKIVVEDGPGDAVDTSTWIAALNAQLRTNYLNGNQPGLLFSNGDPSVAAFPFIGLADRMLTLNEDFDGYGRLIQTIGTFDLSGLNNQGLPTWGLPYLSAATEAPAAGATEVWQIMNLTGDTHPVHFHLVNVQLIQRQAFEGNPSGWSYSGPPMPPDENETGWKETVRVNPGEIASVIMQFNLPALPTQEMREAVSPRTGGREYVWHCHILEHEEHDMMRPLIIR